MQKPKQNLQTDVWLLVGLTGSAPGVLSWQNGALSLTLHGRGHLLKSHTRKLSRMLKDENIGARLQNDEHTTIFKVSLDKVDTVNFPWYAMSCGVNLTIDSSTFRISFIRPSNTTHQSGIGDIFPSRETGQAWRLAFASLCDNAG